MKTMIRGTMTGAAAALLLLAGMPDVTQAATAWTNTAGGTFSTDGNWNNTHPLTGTNAVFGLPGQTYPVSFSGAAASGGLLVTGVNQTVQFNLNGNTYNANSANASGVVAAFGTNAGDNVKLVVNGGTLTLGYHVGGSSTYLGYPSSPCFLLITNGGKFIASYLYTSDSSTITVSDPGSFYQAGYGGSAWQGASVTVSNGAAMEVENISMTGNILVDNASLTNAGGGFRTLQYGGTVTVRNGGTIQSAGQFEMGVSGGSGKVYVGNGSPSVSTVVAPQLMFGTTFDPGRGAPEMIINSNGLVRATQTSQSVFIYDQGTLTMNGGTLQVAAGGEVDTVDLNTSAYGQGTLRGYGSISRYGAGSNFSINNEGIIRVGDTNGTPSMGTLAISNGNLYQTNTAKKAITYFEFGNTAYDQISIANGLAMFTAGTNSFSLASGAPAPVHGVKYGLGMYDFIIATNITYNVSTMDNLTYLLTNTYHLTYNVDFTYGVVPLAGGLFALELQFVPEPSTVLLLALGGLMVCRRMAKRGKKVISND